MEQARWTIDDYTIASGESPVRTFLSGLQDRDKVEAFALIQLLSERGNTLRLPHSRSLGEGLNELRGKQVRIFYVFRPQRRIVLLDGMVKKRDDIPAATLNASDSYNETSHDEKKRTIHGLVCGATLGEPFVSPTS